MNSLFKPYDMDGFVRHTPSVWQTSYVAVNGQTVNSEVRLLGNHGTYSAPGRTHMLENLDIVTEESPDGDFNDIVTGTWRFSPGTSKEATGTFRWSIHGGGERLAGTSQMTGNNQQCDWTSERLEIQIQNEFNLGSSGAELDAAAPEPELQHLNYEAECSVLPGEFPYLRVPWELWR